jgi:hypothetical protein
MKIHRPIKNATMPPTKAVQRNRIEIIDQALVDNEQWYVIQVEPRVVPWVREQNQELWYEHLTCNQRYRVLDTFDVHEKLYTMLAMRWA